MTGSAALRVVIEALEQEMRDWADLRLEHGGYVKSFVVDWADRLASLRSPTGAPER